MIPQGFVVGAATVSLLAAFFSKKRRATSQQYLSLTAIIVFSKNKKKTSFNSEQALRVFVCLFDINKLLSSRTFYHYRIQQLRLIEVECLRGAKLSCHHKSRSFLQTQ
jgi:hypothetical protein